MNELIERKLKRLKGEQVDEISTEGIEIEEEYSIEGDLAYRSYMLAMSKLYEFEKRIKEMSDQHD